MEEQYQEIMMMYGGLFAQELRNSLEQTTYPYAFGFNKDAYSKGRNSKYSSSGDKVATGNLRDSIEAVWDNSSNSVIIEMLYYWKFVNDGREPGKYVPIKPLEEWAKKRGIENPRSAAFGISTNIKKFGIEPTYFYDKAFIEFDKNYGPDLERDLLQKVEDFFNKITEQSIK